ncbi:hypothetical protein ACQPYK_09375 [Streptosporangium sp. CA-135522]|uniref:hypothetical protein n=1 Tax=Streptosporangium sp. CA-135522 TaxID=3240072 RepID=UPI003D91BEAA
MTTGQTAAEPRTEERENDDTSDPAGQESPPETLRRLAELVNAQGVRTSIGHRVGLRLYGDRPDPFPRSDRFELVAHSPGGWEVATVTVGERTGRYMVSLPTIGVECQSVSPDVPGAVVDLILAAMPKEAA